MTAMGTSQAQSGTAGLSPAVMDAWMAMLAQGFLLPLLTLGTAVTQSEPCPGVPGGVGSAEGTSWPVLLLGSCWQQD